MEKTSDTYLSFFLSTEGLMEKASLFLIDSALQSNAGLGIPERSDANSYHNDSLVLVTEN